MRDGSFRFHYLGEVSMAAKAKGRRIISKHQRSTTGEDTDIGMRIRLRRIELGMSQHQLGQALGVTFQQIQKYEKGHNRISISRFLETCRALKVDPNYLAAWEGKPLNVNDAQTNDSVNLRMAQAISLLPIKLRNPVQILIRSLQELSPADLK